MSRFLKAACAATVALTALPAFADTLGLGRTATPEEVSAWDIDVRPDGQGLPEGSGDAIIGEEVFVEKCAVCHGDFAEGVGRWPVLAGGQGTLASHDPVKTVGSYWPYLSTVWDYVNRAMPFGEAQSLSNDEVYAIVAYILYSNDLVEDDFVLSKETFLDVEMPNADGFFPDDRTESPLWGPREVCMENCKPSVEITKRAAIIDVTPETEDDAATTTETTTEETAVVVAAVEEVAAPALDEALVKKGEKVFKKCKSCHQVGDKAKNRTGPMLNNIVDAPIGAVEGFKYSKVFKKLADDGAVWDMEALDGFLTKPKKWAKGTKMSFGGLRKEDDRLAVIEYLKSVSN